ncbi:cytochrome P450 [Streptomyces werraensis]|uniref:Cytochrome P450 n=1 Tax=Streptomyces werraensis TaxID=68284 RepID=A0ABV3JSG3_9ACTN
MPVAPGAVPLLGHALTLMRNPAAWLTACRATGPLVEIRLGGRAAFLACTPELVNEMLTTKMKQFDKGGPLFDRARAVFGAGLVTTTHDAQRQQRPLMQPAFSREGLASYVEAMQQESEALTATWRPGTPLDILAEMHALTMRVFLRVMLPSAEIAQHASLASQIKGLTDGVAARTALPWMEKIPNVANRRYAQARKQLWDTARRAADRSQPDLGRLLKALSVSDAEGKTLTEEELAPQIVNLLVAGTETNAALLTWIFHLLDREPEVQGRLRHEMADVLGGRPANLRDMHALTLTRNVILETMRLMPPIWALTRTTASEVELGGYRFPAGTDFVFSPYQLHHDPAYFPDPEAFVPDRWNELSNRAEKAFIPFGAGRRRCIGETFALAETTIALSTVLSRWTLRTVPGSRTRPRFRSSLNAAGMRMIPTEAREPSLDRSEATSPLS